LACFRESQQLLDKKKNVLVDIVSLVVTGFLLFLTGCGASKQFSDDPPIPVRQFSKNVHFQIDFRIRSFIPVYFNLEDGSVVSSDTKADFEIVRPTSPYFEALENFIELPPTSSNQWTYTSKVSVISALGIIDLFFGGPKHVLTRF
jgi:hypothetical protein